MNASPIIKFGIMFRLASAADYEYLPDIGLYELTFDKRPVQGVRCECPVQGAQQYNACQQRVKAVRVKKRRHRENFTPLQDLSWDGIFDWCIAKGTSEECRLVLAFYRCQSRAQGWHIIDELRQHDGIHRETNILLFMGLFTICGNQVSSADKIQSVEWKATAIENDGKILE